MSGPVLVWEQLGLGFVRPLDEFVERANSGPRDSGDLLRTPDPGKPLERSFRRARRPRPPARHPGELGVVQPGLPAADPWSGRGRAAELAGILCRGEGDPGTRSGGAGLRPARRAWHTVYTGFATQLWSCGGCDFDPDGSWAIASDAAVEVARTLSEAIRVAGPADWTSQGWYELAMDFAHGKFGLLGPDDDHVAYFETPSCRTWQGRCGTPCRPQAQAASGARTCGCGQWS